MIPRESVEAVRARLIKDADIYKRQIIELRSKSLPHDTTLGIVTGLMEAAEQLKHLLNDNTKRTN